MKRATPKVSPSPAPATRFLPDLPPRYANRHHVQWPDHLQSLRSVRPDPTTSHSSVDRGSPMLRPLPECVTTRAWRKGCHPIHPRRTSTGNRPSSPSQNRAARRANRGSSAPWIWALSCRAAEGGLSLTLLHRPRPPPRDLDRASPPAAANDHAQPDHLPPAAAQTSTTSNATAGSQQPRRRDPDWRPRPRDPATREERKTSATAITHRSFARW